LDKKFSVYPGKFPCHTCKEEVGTIRVWLETTDVTWMCTKKHISKVRLVPDKKHYEKKNKNQGGV
jgi:hypothetical protein